MTHYELTYKLRSRCTLQEKRKLQKAIRTKGLRAASPKEAKTQATALSKYAGCEFVQIVRVTHVMLYQDGEEMRLP